MNLADHILAGRGKLHDMGLALSSVSKQLQQAQRFEMHDDVVKAAAELIHTKPSTLNSALPMCRLPYPIMWLEYNGGLGSTNTRDPMQAPIPARQGFLIESPSKDWESQVGYATVCWYHRTLPGESIQNAPFLSPFSIYFDWRKDGDVKDIIRGFHAAMLDSVRDDKLKHGLLKGCVQWIENLFLKTGDKGTIQRFFRMRYGWEKFVNDQKEIEAMLESERHLLAGISPHGMHMLLEGMTGAFQLGEPEAFRGIIENWLADIQGEGVFLECFLALMNSKNCIIQQPIDLSRLNKARAKRGKPALLDYTTTRLSLSRSQARTAAASGITHEAARQHLVRGHFKIRRTGVYWWVPHLRGKAGRGVLLRKGYEVER